MPEKNPDLLRGPASLPLPRGLILGASVWLVVSWMFAIGLRPPLEASSASYTPGVRLLLVCAAIGTAIAWPLVRLTQPPSHYPVRQTILDLVVLLALMQVVIWPLRLVTPWTPLRTAALDATIAAWAVLIGAFVASAVGSDRAGPRCLAMTGCVLACIGGPAVAWVLSLARPGAAVLGALVRTGPVLEVYALTVGETTPAGADLWAWILLVGLAGTAAWVGLTSVGPLRARGAPQRPSW